MLSEIRFSWRAFLFIFVVIKWLLHLIIDSNATLKEEIESKDYR